MALLGNLRLLGIGIVLGMIPVATPSAWAQLLRLPPIRQSPIDASAVEFASYDPPSYDPALGPPEPYLDLDAYLAGDPPRETQLDFYTWQVLPEGLIYRPYLAGPKESRFSTHLINETDDEFLWDATLGTQVGLLRYGSQDPVRPIGFQIDAEGSAQVRLDVPEEVDVRSVDFRAGLPITFGYGRSRTKFAYYHLSSHLGDEFLLKNSDFDRISFARDVLVLGQSYYLTDEVRIYAEAGWAFHSRVAKEWEFQFGLEYAPLYPTGIHGRPFFAINGHLREELNYGGGLTVQTGWAWRGVDNAHLLRTGLQYYNGESTQFSFFDRHEQQIGFGVWYDR